MNKHFSLWFSYYFINFASLIFRPVCHWITQPLEEDRLGGDPWKCTEPYYLEWMGRLMQTNWINLMCICCIWEDWEVSWLKPVWNWGVLRRWIKRGRFFLLENLDTMFHIKNRGHPFKTEVVFFSSQKVARLWNCSSKNYGGKVFEYWQDPELTSFAASIFESRVHHHHTLWFWV